GDLWLWRNRCPEYGRSRKPAMPAPQRLLWHDGERRLPHRHKLQERGFAEAAAPSALSRRRQQTPRACEAAAATSFCVPTPSCSLMAELSYAAWKSARRMQILTNAPLSLMSSLKPESSETTLTSLPRLLTTFLNLKRKRMTMFPKKRKKPRIVRLPIVRSLTFRTPKGP